MKFLQALVVLVLASSLVSAAQAQKFSGGLTDCPSESDPNVIYYNTRNAAEGSTLLQNRGVVYRVVINRATFRSGSVSYDYGSDPDHVYGYSACGGFSVPGECVQCLVDARESFEQVAPLAVGARTCRKNGEKICFLRYENYSF